MFDQRLPPSQAERKLFARLQAKVSPDEEVLAAVGLMRGPRPGTETLLPIIGVFIDVAVAVLVFLGVMKSQKHFIPAATAGQGILFRSTWRGRPTERVSTLDLSEVGEINDATGDSFIELFVSGCARTDWPAARCAEPCPWLPVNRVATWRRGGVARTGR